jgi:hypothetical protein
MNAALPRWSARLLAWFEVFWFAPVPAARLGAFRALVCAVALYDVLLYAPVVFADAAAVSAGAVGRPWQPLLFMEVLGLRPVDLTTAWWLQATAIGALGLGALGVLSRWSCAVGALAFLYWTGLAYSFGKPHHDKVALCFALAALPFAPVGLAVSVDALVRTWWRRWRGGPNGMWPVPTVAAAPLRLTQVTIALGYFGAGMAKVLIGGPTWFNGYTLQGIMLGHDAVLSRAMAQSVLLCQLQSVGLVFVQVAFPSVFFWPRLGWFFLPAATGFHLMTWLTMDTGPYLRLWLLLFVFVPMERIPAAMRRWLRGGGLAAVLAAAAALGLPALVIGIVRPVLPDWALLAVGLPLGWAALRHLRHGPVVASGSA